MAEGQEKLVQLCVSYLDALRRLRHVLGLVAVLAKYVTIVPNLHCRLWNFCLPAQQLDGGKPPPGPLVINRENPDKPRASLHAEDQMLGEEPVRVVVVKPLRRRLSRTLAYGFQLQSPQQAVQLAAQLAALQAALLKVLRREH